MAFFKWEDRYDLKVKDMNDEHKILIDRMNHLHDVNENGKEAVSKAFRDLAEYATKHFKDEEAYMEGLNYPDLDKHKLLHKSLLQKVTEYGEAIEVDGKAPKALFDFLNIWLSSHICGIDMKYAKFAKDGSVIF